MLTAVLRPTPLHPAINREPPGIVSTRSTLAMFSRTYRKTNIQIYTGYKQQISMRQKQALAHNEHFLLHLFTRSKRDPMYLCFLSSNCEMCALCFKIFWKTSVLFVGPLIPLFWTSGDVCPWVSKLGWVPCLYASLST